MNGFKDDTEQKFIKLYQAYVDEIYQFICMRTGLNKEFAEDMTQDIFLSVYKGLKGFKGLCSERTWIYKIAKNKLNDYYRKMYTQNMRLVELDEQLDAGFYDSGQDLEQFVVTNFEKQRVSNCLNKLPQLYKISLILKYVDGMSTRQIAAIAEKSEKATESILTRARKAFIYQYQSSEYKEESENEEKI